MPCHIYFRISTIFPLLQTKILIIILKMFLSLVSHKGRFQFEGQITTCTFKISCGQCVFPPYMTTERVFVIIAFFHIGHIQISCPYSLLPFSYPEKSDKLCTQYDVQMLFVSQNSHHTSYTC
jgi:hypothetical protein